MAAPRKETAATGANRRGRLGDLKIGKSFAEIYSTSAALRSIIMTVVVVGGLLVVGATGGRP